MSFPFNWPTSDIAYDKSNRYKLAPLIIFLDVSSVSSDSDHSTMRRSRGEDNGRDDFSTAQEHCKADTTPTLNPSKQPPLKREIKHW